MRASSAEFDLSFKGERTELYKDTTLGALVETISGLHGTESVVTASMRGN